MESFSALVGGGFVHAIYRSSFEWFIFSITFPNSAKRMSRTKRSVLKNRHFDTIIYTIIFNCGFHKITTADIRSVRMKVSFKKLWVLCAEKEMSKAELRKKSRFVFRNFYSA